MNAFCKLIYMMATVLLFAACSRKTGPLTSSMDTGGLHHKWKVTRIGDVSLTNAVYMDLRDVYRSGATAGCRYFSFTPKFGHHYRMEMANIAAHLADCADNREDILLRSNLESVYSFSLTSNQLKLLKKDGTIVFVAEKAANDGESAIARKWMIQEMINADNDQLIKAGSFLDLSSLAGAHGSVGCNKLSFKVAADDTYHMDMKDVAATKMYCKEAATNESVFIKMLPLVNKYQVIGNTLKLFDKDNILLLAATAPI